MFRLAAIVVLQVLLVQAGFAAPRIDAVAEFARQKIADRLSSDGFDAEVAVIGRPSGGNPAAEGKLGMSMRPIDGRWPRARIAVVIELTDDAGNPVGTSTVWLAIDIPSGALVYAEAHRPGDRPTAAQMTERTINRAMVSGTPLASADALQGLRLQRSVRPGQVVLIEDFEQEPDVLRDDRVSLSIQTGGLSIHMSATALRDGRIGDIVDVRAERATASVRARIISKGVVSLVQ